MVLAIMQTAIILQTASLGGRMDGCMGHMAEPIILALQSPALPMINAFSLMAAFTVTIQSDTFGNRLPTGQPIRGG